MSSAIGPMGPNYTTTRPAVIPGGTDDTWFKDCSAPGAADGTIPEQSWFNVVTAQLREAIRKAGVTLDNSNDDMLFEAMTSVSQAALKATWGLRVAGGQVEMLLGKSVLPVITDVDVDPQNDRVVLFDADDGQGSPRLVEISVSDLVTAIISGGSAGGGTGSGGSGVPLYYDGFWYSGENLSNYASSVFQMHAAEDAKRVVVVSVAFSQNTTTTPSDPNSVLIDGVAATKITSANVVENGNDGFGLSLWYAVIPSGSSGIVEVQFPSGRLGCSVGMWSLVPTNTTPVDFGGDTVPAADANHSVTLGNTSNGSAVISSANARQGTNIFAWPGTYTQDYSHTSGAGDSDTGGAHFTATGASSADCTRSVQGSGKWCHLAAAWT